jgi:large subunit ribosomal protein L20
MARIKAGVQTRARRKKILKAVKGYYGRRKNTIRAATAAFWRAGNYAYRDRRNKKRNFRALWIQRINAAVRAEGLTYSRFMGNIKKLGIDMDRKVLADLAMNQPAAFNAILEKARAV